MGLSHCDIKGARSWNNHLQTVTPLLCKKSCHKKIINSLFVIMIRINCLFINVIRIKLSYFRVTTFILPFDMYHAKLYATLRSILIKFQIYPQDVLLPGSPSNFYLVTTSLVSPWLLWWPPAESHYNVYDQSAVGYVSHVHCIVLLYSVGNKITTTT